jgi:hypothetical protein
MLTGKEEQISAMAMPTNQVKKETMTHPHTSDAGPVYCRLLPYSGVIPVKSVIVEKEMASVLNSVCNNTYNRIFVPLSPFLQKPENKLGTYTDRISLPK